MLLQKLNNFILKLILWRFKFESLFYLHNISNIGIIFLWIIKKSLLIEPDKRSGKPCIRGMRITVQDILEYLAGDMSEAEILKEFPDLTDEDIRACLAYAADRERKLANFSDYEIAV